MTLRMSPDHSDWKRPIGLIMERMGCFLTVLRGGKQTTIQVKAEGFEPLQDAITVSHEQASSAPASSSIPPAS
jgi:hypothetical protein